MKKASIIMMVGPLFLLGLYIFPLWNIMLGAPQYPDPLGLNIHINGLKGVNEFDIQNIDGLNHYIGMHTLPKAEDMWEFGTFPTIIGIMVAIGVVIGMLGYFNKVGHKWFWGWFVLMSILGMLGMYDFNEWLMDYGTNLDPNAIMKLSHPDGTPMTYKPPLLGHVKMLNFDVTSLPSTGAWLMFAGMMLTLAAGFLGWKSTKKQ
ncbi:MAG: LPXTG cell wall anchor domain-containing protein [Flavobacteriaceae bacterium]|jgi:LPXTG-motif cell wall-anchored protein|uniref:LPXTG cell wall anchor domain-containing protein n=1 Tax=Flagellimonas sp. SN16 TaxID=3415142 RepID=UPI000E28846B|nr:LPXTG cell wall anchor domain-containing protein [Flavobacteriaceae bacterium]